VLRSLDETWLQSSETGHPQLQAYGDGVTTFSQTPQHRTRLI
jgi:hypothetical protein